MFSYNLKSGKKERGKDCEKARVVEEMSVRIGLVK
jgi:hypothetical protein